MHKLDRSCVTAPACLDNYDFQVQSWGDLRSDCKREVRLALVQFQGIPGITTEDASEHGLRCAYCESHIRHNGHIEHFRRKNPVHHPELTFAWINLFLSCGSKDHCGHYKDRKTAPAYNPNRIIKPDEQDPEFFLYFHSSGEVRVREGLCDTDKILASETIRVFGLGSPSLVGSRVRVVNIYRKSVMGVLEELMSWSHDDREAYLSAEIEATRWEPYSTTIKHFLQKQV